MNSIIKIVSDKSFDWSQKTVDLAEKLNCSYMYIYSLRQKFAPKTIKNMSRIKVHCELINLKTGQIIKAKSVTEFCKKAQLYKKTKNAQHHISYCVLKREAGIYKNWTTIKHYNFLNKDFSLKDSYGNNYTINGLKLKAKFKGIYKLLSGKIPSYAGLYLKETEIKGIKPIVRFKNTYFKRGGQIFCIEKGKQEEFAEKYDISRHSLADLKYGKIAKAKGFEFYKGVEEDTTIL